MTWITEDGKGTRWVDVTPERKPRRTPRALKFGDVQVGAQLMIKPGRASGGFGRQVALYYIVTDRWFDPVEGQRDPIAGQMVGYSQIKPDGSVRENKSKTTVRGLASQQFDYADIDYIAMCKARVAAMEDGDVVGIGRARAILARPKLPGGL